MSRPGFVLDVDKATPPILFWRGDQLTTEKLPEGSLVVYPPENSARLANPAATVQEALSNPVVGEPLQSQLRADMKLTISFDDSNYPMLTNTGTDARRRMVEAVLEMAATTGIDDVVLIAARGLKRRMTQPELLRALGERVYESFARKGLLRQHDADDKENLVDIGGDVELNKRVAESDLLVHVGLSLTPADCGWNKIVAGLVSAKTIGDGSDERLASIGDQVSKTVKTFQIEATIDVDDHHESFSFLNKREREWVMRDKARFAVAREVTALAPARFDRQMLRNVKVNQTLTGVYAGEVEAVSKTIMAKHRADRTTAVNGQADIVSLGLPSFLPFGTGSISNPVLMAGAIAQMLGLHDGTPLVRDGGVTIVHHPTRPEFHTVHHSAYIDFFHQVLAESTDIVEVSKHEQRFAEDEWFSQIYRNSYAFHGTHPFHVWRSVNRAISRLGGVIVVGGDTATVRHLGFKPASTFQDAMEMARDATGSLDPSLTHLHAPPLFTVEVS